MRNILQNFLRNVGQGSGRRLVDHRSFRGHFDDRVHGTHAEGEIDRGQVAHFEDETFTLKSVEPVSLD